MVQENLYLIKLIFVRLLLHLNWGFKVKSIWPFLSLILMNVEIALAQDSINTTSVPHEYSMYTDMIVDIVEEHERNLSDLLGNGLECRLVNLKPNILKKPGIFRKGMYSLTLSAKCNKSFTDLKLKVTYGEDYGNPWGLTVSYKTPDRQRHKVYSEVSPKE